MNCYHIKDYIMIIEVVLFQRDYVKIVLHYAKNDHPNLFF